MSIVPYKEEYARYFRDLNIAWLERYFFVEPKDMLLLENVEREILDKGGLIYFARYGATIVGCYSLLRTARDTFELGKMAVDDHYQGRKIGQRLVRSAIRSAKEQGASKLLLYSSTKLPTALHIYQKFGFEQVPLEKEIPYLRSDIKMELSLV